MMHKLLLSSLISLSIISGAQAGEVTVEQAAAKQAFGHYLSAWVSQSATPENLEEIFAHDAVVELKLAARPDWSLHIDGRQAIGRFVREASPIGNSWSFSGVRYFTTSRPDVLFAQYTSTATFEGQAVTRNNLVVIEFDGERIVHLKDLNGTPAVIEALLGGTRLAAQPYGGTPGQ